MDRFVAFLSLVCFFSTLLLVFEGTRSCLFSTIIESNNVPLYVAITSICFPHTIVTFFYYVIAAFYLTKQQIVLNYEYLFFSHFQSVPLSHSLCFIFHKPTCLLKKEFISFDLFEVWISEASKFSRICSCIFFQRWSCQELQ